MLSQHFRIGCLTKWHKRRAAALDRVKRRSISLESDLEHAVIEVLNPLVASLEVVGLQIERAVAGND